MTFEWSTSDQQRFDACRGDREACKSHAYWLFDRLREALAELEWRDQQSKEVAEEGSELSNTEKDHASFNVPVSESELDLIEQMALEVFNTPDLKLIPDEDRFMWSKKRNNFNHFTNPWMTMRLVREIRKAREPR